MKGSDYLNLVHNINFKKLGISCAISVGVGALSAFASMSGMENYEKAVKPPLSPPAWLFPIVWTTLFLLMGISAYLIYTDRFATKDEKSSALWVYTVQLAVNFFWPIIFFNQSAYLFAFIWILLLLALIIIMTVKFYAINKTAGLLQIPYIVWVSFATYLTFATYLLNK